MAWINVAADSLQYVTGTPALIESSPGVRRTFCARCGSSLTYWNHLRGGEIDVAVVTLDDAALHAPIDHIWMEDALPWDQPADGLPQFARSRTRS